MNLTAIMPVRNEDWILGASLRIALMWCDSVVALDHASSDRTPEILRQVAEECPGRVHWIAEPDPAWPEMAHRQRLLEVARDIGSTHIALTDADEILTGNLLPVIRERIEKLPPGGCLHVGMPCMWRSLHEYRTDSRYWSNRWDLSIAFCDRPDLHWASLSGYDHHHRIPHKSRIAARIREPGGVMHLQWVNWRRLTAKHALYKITERMKYPNRSVREIDLMYNLAINEAGLAVAPAPVEWWEPYRHFLCHIALDGEPWQERAAVELYLTHGFEMFQGLNLFGIPELAKVAA